MKNKIIIMKTKPEITDDEIRSYMNFDRLVRQAKDERKSRRAIRNAGMILLGVTVLSATWYMIGGSSPAGKTTSTKDILPAPESRPNPADSSIAIQAHPPKKESNAQLTEQQSKRGETTPAKSSTQSNDPKTDKKLKIVPQAEMDSAAKSTHPPLANVYKQAEPLDGYPSLYEYFTSELRYPQEVIADSIEGVVLVAFTINPQGRPEKIIIEQSLGPAFDQEGVRVIAKMPDWKPASYNDKPVPSRISVPLTFEIKRIKAND